MEVIFPPVWMELKIKVKSREDMEYVMECLKDIDGTEL